MTPRLWAASLLLLVSATVQAAELTHFIGERRLGARIQALAYPDSLHKDLRSGLTNRLLMRVSLLQGRTVSRRAVDQWRGSERPSTAHRRGSSGVAERSEPAGTIRPSCKRRHVDVEGRGTAQPGRARTTRANPRVGQGERQLCAHRWRCAGHDIGVGIERDFQPNLRALHLGRRRCRAMAAGSRVSSVQREPAIGMYR
jgi:hypothetical protein